MSVKEMSVFPTSGANEAFAQYFTGQSYPNMLSKEQEMWFISRLRLSTGTAQRQIHGFST